MTPKFLPGRNIAMKVPDHEYQQTATFYRDILGFEELQDRTPARRIQWFLAVEPGQYYPPDVRGRGLAPRPSPG